MVGHRTSGGRADAGRSGEWSHAGMLFACFFVIGAVYSAKEVNFTKDHPLYVNTIKGLSPVIVKAQAAVAVEVEALANATKGGITQQFAASLYAKWQGGDAGEATSCPSPAQWQEGVGRGDESLTRGGGNASCTPHPWQDVLRCLDQGKMPSLNTTVRLVGTSKVVTSTFNPTAAELDPTGVANAYFGDAPDFSRPGAILLLVSDKYLQRQRPLGKLWVGWAVKALAQNFYGKDASRSKYDLLIFYYPNCTPEQKALLNRTIAEELPKEVRVIWHPFAQGSDIPHPEVAQHFGKKDGYMTTCGINPRKMGWSADYLAMSTFRVLNKFRMPILKKYRYVWELDGDVTIDEAPCDPFEVMRRGGFLQGHYGEVGEVSYCPQKGFREAMVEFGRQNGLCTASLDAVETGTSWMGFFMVADMRLFSSPLYLAAAEAYIKTGGLWKHRWTDQSFWPLVMALIAPGQSKRFSGWRFRHKGSALSPDGSNLPDPMCGPPS